MSIINFNSLSPTTLLAVEEKKPSKFSKIDSFKNLDNPFKKIVLVVIHIFITLRNWVCKSFSKNITKADLKKTIEVKPNENSLLPVIKSNSVTKSENAACLSPEEIASFKTQIIILKECQYVKEYEEKTGKLPSEDHLLEVFNDEKLKQLSKEIDQLLQKLTPEDVEKLRKKWNQTIKFAGDTSTQEQVRLCSLQGVLGCGAAVVVNLTGMALTSYLNTSVVSPLVEGSQRLLGIGEKGFQCLAILNRGWNWGKRALLGAKIAKNSFNLAQNKICIIAALYMAGSIGYRGIMDYINNPEKAISNEGGFVARKAANIIVNNAAIKLGRFCLSEKKSDSVEQKSFNYGYNLSQNIFLAFFMGSAILDVLGLKPF